MIDRQDGAIAADARPSSWWLVDECEISGLIAQHGTLRGLCDELEACADRLPDRGAIACAARITSDFVEVLQRHEVAEQAMFGGLFQSGASATLPSCFRHCHAVDHVHAEDLHETLLTAAQTVGPVKADTLSYMMRCLFEGCHRGIDLQEAGMLLFAGKRLTMTARLAVLASLTGPA